MHEAILNSDKYGYDLNRSRLGITKLAAMSEGPASSMEEDAYSITEATAFAKQHPEERYDLPPFQREDESENRFMVERPPGSNHWYQYYLRNESLNELRLWCAPSKKSEEVIEWIDKRSSRLGRIGLSTKRWRYIKGSDGAWLPRGTAGPLPEPAKKKPKKATSGQGKRAGSGKQGDSPSTSGQGDAAGDLGGGVKSKKAPKKSRLGMKSAANSDASESESEGNSGGDRKQDDDGKAAAMAALSQWFLNHNKSLTLKLPGTVESRGLEPPAPPKEKSEHLKDGGGATAAKGKHGDDSDHDQGSHDIDSIAHARGGVAASSRPQGTAGKAKRAAPRPMKLVPLEEDDLFGGLPQLKRVNSLATGSMHVSPMNSLLPQRSKGYNNTLNGPPHKSGLTRTHHLGDPAMEGSRVFSSVLPGGNGGVKIENNTGQHARLGSQITIDRAGLGVGSGGGGSGVKRKPPGGAEGGDDSTRVALMTHEAAGESMPMHAEAPIIKVKHEPYNPSPFSNGPSNNKDNKK